MKTSESTRAPAQTREADLGNLSVAAGFYADVTANLRAHDDIFMLRGDGLDAYLLRDFLSSDECEQLIGFIDEDHYPSTVMGVAPCPDFRNSESSALGRRQSAMVRDIDRRIALLTGIPQAHQEGIEGQRYAVGQQFMPHYDFFHTDQDYWPREREVGGQRTWTVMICLNTPDAGGGTLFPRAGLRVRPRRGNLLAWCNHDANGELNHQSLHCGEPVEAGKKYILTKWHRERAFTAGRRPVEPPTIPGFPFRLRHVAI